MTEEEMQKAEVPRFDTIEELNTYINNLVNQPHDYGTCVYAMSMASVATFNFMARKLGVTGFQASCADLDFLARTRNMKLGFIVLNGRDLMYPQYDLRKRLEDFITQTMSSPNFLSEVRKSFNEDSAVPAVREHWKSILQRAEDANNNQKP
jgi:hypothetical protein